MWLGSCVLVWAIIVATSIVRLRPERRRKRVEAQQAHHWCLHHEMLDADELQRASRVMEYVAIVGSTITCVLVAVILVAT
jgi:hypothetical protein